MCLQLHNRLGFGVSTKITLDGGSQFTSGFFRHLQQIMDIQHIRTTTTSTASTEANLSFATKLQDRMNKVLYTDTQKTTGICPTRPFHLSIRVSQSRHY